MIIIPDAYIHEPKFWWRLSTPCARCGCQNKTWEVLTLIHVYCTSIATSIDLSNSFQLQVSEKATFLNGLTLISCKIDMRWWKLEQLGGVVDGGDVGLSLVSEKILTNVIDGCLIVGGQCSWLHSGYHFNLQLQFLKLSVNTSGAGGVGMITEWVDNSIWMSNSTFHRTRIAFLK